MRIVLLCLIALPALGQELDIIGTWEADGSMFLEEGLLDYVYTGTTIRLTFEEDGSMELLLDIHNLTPLLLPPEKYPGYHAEMGYAFPALQLSVSYMGTYQMDTRNIGMQLEVTGITIGGLEPLDGLLEFGKRLMPVMALISGVDPEDYPAFEAEELVSLFAMYDDDEVREGYALEPFAVEYQYIDLNDYKALYLDFPFRFGHFLIPESDFMRVTATGIRPISWGMVKNGF